MYHVSIVCLEPASGLSLLNMYAVSLHSTCTDKSPQLCFNLCVAPLKCMIPGPSPSPPDVHYFQFYWLTCKNIHLSFNHQRGHLSKWNTFGPLLTELCHASQHMLAIIQIFLFIHVLLRKKSTDLSYTNLIIRPKLSFVAHFGLWCKTKPLSSAFLTLFSKI